MPRSALLLLLALSGCASGGLEAGNSGPSTTRMETGGGGFEITAARNERVASHDVLAPADRVWAALPAAYQAMGLTGGVVNQAERVFGTPLIRSRGRLAGERAARFLNCGTNPIGAPAANLYDLETTVRTAVQTNPDGTTRLEVLVQAMAAPPAGGTRAQCTSTRVLEDLIAAQVRRAVAAS
ncbi:MAG TPA: hypothetical protein VGV85_12485 [Longimicrobiaceae bacterium]|nr:hypothetical protein [Longimicrobiaceae bacterium]